MAQCLLRQAGSLATGRRRQVNSSTWRQQTADWRAVCGKTACTVRREGERSRALPTPIDDRGRLPLPRLRRRRQEARRAARRLRTAAGIPAAPPREPPLTAQLARGKDAPFQRQVLA